MTETILDRIKAYKATEVASNRVADLVVDLVDAKAVAKGRIYDVVEEFRNPRHDEFKGGSLWTLYNGITENLKGNDMTLLSNRTRKIQGIFDRVAGHTSLAQIEAAKKAAEEAAKEAEMVALPA